MPVASITTAQALDHFRASLELDPSYAKVIQQRHQAVRAAIEAVLPGTTTHLVGSLQRRTRIDPARGLAGFDIDILVERGSFSRWTSSGGTSPDTALNDLHRALRSVHQYARMDPEADAPVVTLDYSDNSKVELIPAYRDEFSDSEPRGRAFWVPKGGRWVRADYDYDAAYVSAANRAMNGLLIPTIKVAKAWRRRAGLTASGYAVEVSVADSLRVLFGGSYGSLTLVDTVRFALKGFQTDLIRGQAMTFPESLSEPVKMSAPLLANAVDRYKVDRDVSALHSIDPADDRAPAVWGRVFGPPFPGAQ